MILTVLVSCEPTQAVKRLEAEQQQGVCYEVRKVLLGPSTEAPRWALGNVTMTRGTRAVSPPRGVGAVF